MTDSDRSESPEECRVSGGERPPEDHAYALAEERTRLARERTILAHIRTGFASFLFGAGLLGFFHGLPMLAGYVFLTIGVGFIITGWASYIRSSRRTREILERTEVELGLRHRR